MTKVYISGPMRSIPDFNFPAFFVLEQELKDLGFDVLNPARIDAEGGFDWEGTTGNEDLSQMGFNLKEALAHDLKWIITEADVIYMLPGWKNSKGATAERAAAVAAGVEIVDLDE